MSLLSTARWALAQRSALRKSRRMAHARQGLAPNPQVWACGLMLMAFAAAWD